ncbi:hypothetical protein [Novosphingobium sp. P6W]|uniref:hypothetical protein n=1 Tax=Novosphingobium sp. P6W TaxID=1609758 RepID=UPI0006975C21|nr:hypothetical protein [Novosphingobium sp. P6W]AXB80209.1 hypothetical protein TQ38_026830 [Novosphingobium sp. P6W]
MIEDRRAAKVSRDEDGRPLSNRIRDGIRWWMEDGECWVSFQECFERNLGLALRTGQAKRCVRAAFWPHARVRWESETQAVAQFDAEAQERDAILGGLADKLCKVALRPLTPRELLAALPITNRERLRWTKSGRIPRHGTVNIRRGQIVAVPTYSVTVVEELLLDAGRIENWRASDLTNMG